MAWGRPPDRARAAPSGAWPGRGEAPRGKGAAYRGAAKTSPARRGAAIMDAGKRASIRPAPPPAVPHAAAMRGGRATCPSGIRAAGRLSRDSSRRTPSSRACRSRR
jgi:hypothetical protein